jgi:chromatin remodeling complex protein RSC6
MEANINLNKTNMSKEVRDITMRLETDRDSIKMQLESKVEKVNELTEELSALREEMAEKTDKFDKKEKKFKEDMANWKRDSDKARRELEMEKKQLRDELMGQESTLREEFQMADAKYRESELALKDLS